MPYQSAATRHAVAYKAKGQVATIFGDVIADGDDTHLTPQRCSHSSSSTSPDRQRIRGGRQLSTSNRHVYSTRKSSVDTTSSNDRSTTTEPRHVHGTSSPSFSSPQRHKSAVSANRRLRGVCFNNDGSPNKKAVAFGSHDTEVVVKQSEGKLDPRDERMDQNNLGVSNESFCASSITPTCTRALRCVVPDSRNERYKPGDGDDMPLTFVASTDESELVVLDADCNILYSFFVGRRDGSKPTKDDNITVSSSSAQTTQFAGSSQRLHISAILVTESCLWLGLTNGMLHTVERTVVGSGPAKRGIGWCQVPSGSSKRHAGCISAIVLSTDGFVLTASQDWTIGVWDVSTGAFVGSMKGSDCAIKALAPVAMPVVFPSTVTTTRPRDDEHGYKNDHESHCSETDDAVHKRRLIICDDSTLHLVVAAGDDGSIRAFNIATRKQIALVPSASKHGIPMHASLHKKTVNAIAVSFPNGSADAIVFSGGQEGVVRCSSLVVDVAENAESKHDSRKNSHCTRAGNKKQGTDGKTAHGGATSGGAAADVNVRLIPHRSIVIAARDFPITAMSLDQSNGRLLLGGSTGIVSVHDISRVMCAFSFLSQDEFASCMSAASLPSFGDALAPNNNSFESATSQVSATGGAQHNCIPLVAELFSQQGSSIVGVVPAVNFSVWCLTVLSTSGDVVRITPSAADVDLQVATSDSAKLSTKLGELIVRVTETTEETLHRRLKEQRFAEVEEIITGYNAKSLRFCLQRAVLHLMRTAYTRWYNAAVNRSRSGRNQADFGSRMRRYLVLVAECRRYQYRRFYSAWNRYVVVSRKRDMQRCLAEKLAAQVNYPLILSAFRAWKQGWFRSRLLKVVVPLLSQRPPWRIGAKLWFTSWRRYVQEAHRRSVAKHVLSCLRVHHDVRKDEAQLQHWQRAATEGHANDSQMAAPALIRGYFAAWKHKATRSWPTTRAPFSHRRLALALQESNTTSHLRAVFGRWSKATTLGKTTRGIDPSDAVHVVFVGAQKALLRQYFVAWVADTRCPAWEEVALQQEHNELAESIACMQQAYDDIVKEWPSVTSFEAMVEEWDDLEAQRAELAGESASLVEECNDLNVKSAAYARESYRMSRPALNLGASLLGRLEQFVMELKPKLFNCDDDYDTIRVILSELSEHGARRHTSPDGSISPQHKGALLSTSHPSTLFNQSLERMREVIRRVCTKEGCLFDSDSLNWNSEQTNLSISSFTGHEYNVIVHELRRIVVAYDALDAEGLLDDSDDGIVADLTGLPQLFLNFSLFAKISDHFGEMQLEMSNRVRFTQQRARVRKDARLSVHPFDSKAAMGRSNSYSATYKARHGIVADSLGDAGLPPKPQAGSPGRHNRTRSAGTTLHEEYSASILQTSTSGTGTMSGTMKSSLGTSGSRSPSQLSSPSGYSGIPYVSSDVGEGSETSNDTRSFHSDPLVGTEFSTNDAASISRDDTGCELNKHRSSSPSGSTPSETQPAVRRTDSSAVTLSSRSGIDGSEVDSATQGRSRPDSLAKSGSALDVILSGRSEHVPGVTSPAYYYVPDPIVTEDGSKQPNGEVGRWPSLLQDQPVQEDADIGASSGPVVDMSPLPKVAQSMQMFENRNDSTPTSSGPTRPAVSSSQPHRMDSKASMTTLGTVSPVSSISPTKSDVPAGATPANSGGPARRLLPPPLILGRSDSCELDGTSTFSPDFQLEHSVNLSSTDSSPLYERHGSPVDRNTPAENTTMPANDDGKQHEEKSDAAAPQGNEEGIPAAAVEPPSSSGSQDGTGAVDCRRLSDASTASHHEPDHNPAILSDDEYSPHFVPQEDPSCGETGRHAFDSDEVAPPAAQEAAEGDSDDSDRLQFEPTGQASYASASTRSDAFNDTQSFDSAPGKSSAEENGELNSWRSCSLSSDDGFGMEAYANEQQQERSPTTNVHIPQLNLRKH